MISTDLLLRFAISRDLVDDRLLCFVLPLGTISQTRWIIRRRAVTHGDYLPLDGVVGSFHKVIAKHMPLYVAEFQFELISSNFDRC